MMREIAKRYAERKSGFYFFIIHYSLLIIHCFYNALRYITLFVIFWLWRAKTPVQHCWSCF